MFLVKYKYFYCIEDFKVITSFNDKDQVLNKAIRISFTFINKPACVYEVNQGLK